MDMTRCFLAETGLPKHLWGKLASPAEFLKTVFRIVPIVMIHLAIECLEKMPIFPVCELKDHNRLFTRRGIMKNVTRALGKVF